jgi:nucleoside 2-deoxyribosyltransferase
VIVINKLLLMPNVPALLACPSRKRVYLAGPEVFFPEASAAFAELEALCDQCGLQGVRPSDGDFQGDEVSLSAQAHAIYRANIALIESCDAVLANLRPFRNHIEPDSGTVFEVGYAIARNLPVATITDAKFSTYRARVEHHLGLGAQTPDAAYDDTFGYLIESFDKPFNLMLSCSTAPFHEPLEAIKYLARLLSVDCGSAATSQGAA